MFECWNKALAVIPEHKKWRRLGVIGLKTRSYSLLQGTKMINFQITSLDMP